MKKLGSLVFILCLAVSSLAFAGEGHSHGNKSCPMKDKQVASSESVTVEGNLLCMHCNLDREKKCRKVLQQASAPDTLIDICPSSKVDLEKISEEGKANLRLTGKMMTASDGSKMFMIESADKI